jgi:hypothetical protein
VATPLTRSTPARARLRGLSPAEAAEACAAGGLLVDIRPAAQREREGEVPGADVAGGFQAWKAAGLPVG